MTIPTFDTNALGLFEGQVDVWAGDESRFRHYDPSTQTYTIAGAGTNMWLDQDEFSFRVEAHAGNFILTARAQFAGAGVNAHRKLGCIIRSGLESNATHVNAVVHGDGLGRSSTGERVEVRPRKCARP